MVARELFSMGLRPGDVVKIVDKWRAYSYNRHGMDRFLGTYTTIQKVYFGEYLLMEEDNGEFMWRAPTIDRIVTRFPYKDEQEYDGPCEICLDDLFS